MPFKGFLISYFKWTNFPGCFVLSKLTAGFALMNFLVSLMQQSDSCENCPVVPYATFLRNGYNIQSE